MPTLLVAEFHNGHLGDVTAKALTAALAIGAPVEVLVAGQGCADAAVRDAGMATGSAPSRNASMRTASGARTRMAIDRSCKRI